MATFKEVLTSNSTYLVIVSLIPISLFFNSGFISAAVILFFVFCFANRSDALSEQINKNKLLLLPIFLYFLFVLGTIYSKNLGEGVNLLSRRIPFLLVPLGFILVKNKISQKELDIVLGLFLICCVISSLVCFGFAFHNIYKFQSILNSNSDSKYNYFFAYDSLTESIGFEPIYLSLFCNVALVICLLTTSIRSSLLRTIVAIYIIFFIFMMASKIGILTLGIIVLFWVFKSPKRNSLILTLVLILIPLFWIGVYKFPFLKDRFKLNTTVDISDPDSGKWGSAAFRLAIWSSAIMAIEKSPVIGYGTGSGQEALLNVYRERNFFRGFTDRYNAHNEFLSTALDLGLVGMFFLCLLMIIALFSSLNSKDVFTILFLMIVVLTFLVESVFFRQRGIVFFSFFYSFLIWRKNALCAPLVEG